MKAIEIKSKTNHKGELKINYQLYQSDLAVRVLILKNESAEDDEEEKLWSDSITTNPAFDFLKDPEEDIYSLEDGKPIT